MKSVRERIFLGIIHMKKSLLCAVISTAAFSQMTFANEATQNAPDWSLSGNVTLASDYRWRGISMTQNEPAIQGGLRVSHKSGAYAGVWASSSDVANGSSIEADFMLGYRHALNDKSALTVQYIDINYPGATAAFDTDFSEISLTYTQQSLFKPNDGLTAAVAYSNNYYFESGDMVRLDARYNYPINSNFGVLVAGGMTQLEDKQAFLKVWGNADKDHYYDWKAGVTSNLFGVFSELYYADNSTVNAAADSMDARVVFSVTKVF